MTFSYDAFGRRLSKTFAGRTTEYIWDGDDLVHERVRQGGEIGALRTWVFEPGTFAPLAKIECRKRFGVVTDHLGTPNVLTTEAGALAWKAQLDIYGVVREESAGDDAADATANPWRYPGQYEDAETGLYYNRFRYYDPETGRYISEDPIGLWGGAALFGHVHGPLCWLDALALTGSCASWKRRRALGNDTGLKDHASRHSSLSAAAYLRRGQSNVADGIPLSGGKHPGAAYWVRKMGDDAYSMTITDKAGKILSIDTWSNSGTPITRGVLERNFRANGIQPTKNFWGGL